MKEVIFMSIVNHKDKRTGVTYVYESESYWDKEKKQPRSKRTLIGKIDEATGEIIPTGKSGRKKTVPKEAVGITKASTPICYYRLTLSENRRELLSGGCRI
jgi:hypothetical protein